ncbi:MAG: glutathione transferase [Deltaproteobacteria bacterium]|nr:glutathione transferase [Deltaproteobacteria bacterium]
MTARSSVPPPAPGSPPLVLYADASWVSPYVFSCFVALHEKGLPFEARTIDLDEGRHLEPPYRDRSLTAKVPALEHGDFWLTESSAIVEYLEDSFPLPIRVLPEAPRERARARQVMSWLRTDLLPLRRERPTRSMFFERATEPLSEEATKAAEKLVRVAEALIPLERTSLFPTFTVADADLAFCLHRLILNGHDVPTRVAAFAAAQWRRPSVRAFVERQRPA